MSSRAPTDRGPTTWAPGCRAGGRLILERLLPSAQLALPHEGGAEVLAVLATQRRLLLLPPAPTVTPGARGLHLGSWVHRPLAGPRPPSLSSLLPRRRLTRMCRSAPDSSGGRCPTRGAERSPLRSLPLCSVNERHDILVPWRSRSAIL